jgi:hypothetical protein
MITVEISVGDYLEIFLFDPKLKGYFLVSLTKISTYHLLSVLRKN